MTTATPGRDRFAAAICNWVMRHVASERYRKMTGGAIRYGLAAAARDEEEGRGLPLESIIGTERDLMGFAMMPERD